MADVYVYTLEDAEGNDQAWSSGKYDEASAEAQERRLRLIENTYEWSDSEMIEDFTEEE